MEHKNCLYSCWRHSKDLITLELHIPPNKGQSFELNGRHWQQ